MVDRMWVRFGGRLLVLAVLLTVLPNTTNADEGDVNIDFGRAAFVRIESADEAHRFVLGGRLLYDAAVYDDDKTALGNGMIDRRARLEMNFLTSKVWYFRMAIDFAGNRSRLRGPNFSYRGIPGLQLKLGSFREPFGMERLNNSGHILMMERAGVSQQLSPGRNAGAGVVVFGDRWAATAGLFAGGETERDEGDEGFSSTGRVTVSPVMEDRRIVQVGFAGSYRKPAAGDPISYASGLETGVADAELVDTGDVTDVDKLLLLGLEALVIAGPVTLQAEHIGITAQREGGQADLGFNGWYVTAGFFLTGESRTVRGTGRTLQRVRPMRPLTTSGVGAVELVGRYSRLDLSSKDVMGGEQAILTLGVNWFATQNYRFVLNYVKVLELAGKADPAMNGDEPSFLQFRGQVDF